MPAKNAKSQFGMISHLRHESEKDAARRLQERRTTARVVASASLDAHDAALLLAALGITAEDLGRRSPAIEVQDAAA